MKICTKCKNNYSLEFFHKNKTSKNGRHSQCKFCINQKRKTIRDATDVNTIRNRNYMNKYGITLEEYTVKFLNQNGMCAICNKQDGLLVVDHCHYTKKVRGLLCHGCNTRLNALEDKEYYLKAKQYLSSFE